MSDRKEALTDLLAMVDAGEFPADGDAREIGLYRVQLDTELPIIKTAYGAFSGSLDAAKALHEAVLPGWGWVWASWGRGHVTPRDQKYSRLTQQGEAPDPARAWLIAILKALIAQED